MWSSTLSLKPASANEHSRTRGQVNKILKECRLSQVDGLITALSLLRAKMMIRNGQRPYAQIDPQFYAPLPDEEVDVSELRKMAKARYDALLARLHG